MTNDKEEYKSQVGGFYTASEGALALLLSRIDEMPIPRIIMFLRWADGEIGSNFGNVNTAIDYWTNVA